MDIGVQTLGFFTALYDLDVLWNSTARDLQPTGSQIRRYTMHISTGTVSMTELTPMKSVVRSQSNLLQQTLAEC